MLTLQKSIANLFTPAFLEAIGWTIIHSLWQGALVAVLLTIVLNTLKNNASTNRYVVSVTALFAMLQISLFTFFTVYEPQATSEILAPSEAEYIAQMAEYDAFIASQHTSTVSFEAYWQTALNLLQTNLHFIVGLWFVGVVLFTLRFMGSLWYVNKLKTQMTQVAPSNWQSMANDLAYKLRLQKKVQVLLSDLVNVPTAVGLLKPIVLMPTSFCTGLTMQEVESILAHELAHIRRNDYLINIFQSIVEILFFYHPATWWISSVVRQERENCCDDMAVSVLGDSMAYSRTLARMNEMAVQYSYTQTTLAFNGKKGSLLFRIKRLFTPKKENNVIAERFAAASIVLAAMLVSLTANAGLVTNKAIEFAKDMASFTPTAPIVTENWVGTEDMLGDTTKRKTKMMIRVDENGKVDTIFMDDKGKLNKVFFFSDDEMMPPLPPEPPLPPDAPLPPDFEMEFGNDFEQDIERNFKFDFDFSDTTKNKKVYAKIFEEGGKKLVIINGDKIDVDSLSKNAKTFDVRNEDGKVKIIIDGKVAVEKDMDIDKNVYVYRNRNHAPKHFGQNSKSFDSLRNTKEYKKKYEKYQKALKDYQELMKEYEKQLRKNDKSLNYQKLEELRAYREAMQDYREVQREQAMVMREIAVEQAREQIAMAREMKAESMRMYAESARMKIESAKMKRESEKMKIESAKFESLKEELKKDGFDTKKINLKISGTKVEIDGKEVKPELAEKYRKIMGIKEGGDVQFSWNEN